MAGPVTIVDSVIIVNNAGIILPTVSPGALNAAGGGTHAYTFGGDKLLSLPGRVTSSHPTEKSLAFTPTNRVA
ncbi:MAG: hypothetical protein WD971_07000 [Pirellulales bacterium]